MAAGPIEPAEPEWAMRDEGSKAIRRIVVVGGGTAGWMVAAPLAKMFVRHERRPCEVVVVDSPEIGTVGTGEATLPTIGLYHQMLGLDGEGFMKKTQATLKLGIEFRDWGRLGHRFCHDLGGLWPSRPTLPHGDPPAASSVAFHLDAGLYAACLREHAMALGARRIEGTIAEVALRPEDGFVAAVKLVDGRCIDGDLFIDCSGSRALLIGDAMGSAYEDWSAWLPCNSVQAVPCVKVDPPAPYTTSTARPAGWQWRIPLRHHTSNGHVYCHHFTPHDEAARLLLEGLDAPPLDAPRRLHFTTGRRRESWVRNVVAVGVSSGFLESLESTGIQLIMDAVDRLIEFFPDRDCHPGLAAEFNRQMARQYESVRDFIVLHYKLTQRTDSEFWRYCAAMQVPDTLAHRMEACRESGRVVVLDREHFSEASWLSIMSGHGFERECTGLFMGMGHLAPAQPRTTAATLLA
jgi:hypothetical protein